MTETNKDTPEASSPEASAVGESPAEAITETTSTEVVEPTSEAEAHASPEAAVAQPAAAAAEPATEAAAPAEPPDAAEAPEAAEPATEAAAPAEPSEAAPAEATAPAAEAAEPAAQAAEPATEAAEPAEATEPPEAAAPAEPPEAAPEATEPAAQAAEPATEAAEPAEATEPPEAAAPAEPPEAAPAEATAPAAQTAAPAEPPEAAPAEATAPAAQTAAPAEPPEAAPAEATAPAAEEAAPAAPKPSPGAAALTEGLGLPEAGAILGPPNLGGFESGQIITGTVLTVSKREVEVDLGDGKVGVVGDRHWSSGSQIDLTTVLKTGDSIEAAVLARADIKQRVTLSRLWAQQKRGWEAAETAAKSKGDLSATVTETVKGGLSLDVNGVRAFMPASLVDVHTVSDLSSYIGKTFDVRVIEADRNKARLIVSRKASLRASQRQQAKAAMGGIKVGQTLTGTVAQITDFGAFVDVEGVRGLVHKSEIGWSRSREPQRDLTVGAEVEVTVLKVQPSRNRLGLSMRSGNDPLREVKKGARFEGTVSRLADFGAFVALPSGVEGLVHVSEMAEYRVFAPEEIVIPGEKVWVKVLKVDKKRRTVDLSMAQAVAPDPPDEAAESQDASEQDTAPDEAEASTEPQDASEQDAQASPVDDHSEEAAETPVDDDHAEDAAETPVDDDHAEDAAETSADDHSEDAADTPAEATEEE